jgi:uncharacterized membrane protein
LVLLGVVTDLAASIFSVRLWIRYMALSLMILGALAAAGSNITGGWEADRVWDALTGPGKDVLERHAWWGDVLPWVFGGLALWRLGVQFIGILAASRPIYLLVAILAGAAIVYQGHLGAVMVYDYGVGSALLATSQTAAPSPSPGLPGPEASISPTPAPSFAPPPTPTIMPTAASSPIMPASPPATPAPTMSSSGSPIASPTGLAPPPLGSAGSPANPPGAVTTPASSAAKNL